MSRKISAILLIPPVLIFFVGIFTRQDIVPVKAAMFAEQNSARERSRWAAGRDLNPVAAHHNRGLQVTAEQSTTGLAGVQICTPDTPGMLSYWPLDDGPGATKFMDVIGSNDGACKDGNCPTNSAGKIGPAFTFNSLAEGGIIAPAHNPSLNWGATGSFSFELWVNTTQVCTDGVSENKVFIGKYKDRNTDDGSWASWWVGCRDDDKAAFSLRDSSSSTAGQVITGTVIINDGKWHHLVAGRDGSTGENFLYVDGELDASLVHTYAGNFTSNNKFNMGYYGVDPYYYFNGRLDEVAIYNRALTEEEIQAHYNGGAGESYCIGPPVAVDDNYTVAEDSGEHIFYVLENDTLAPDSDGTLAIIAVSTGSAGGLTTTDGSVIRYAPAADYFGIETFTYTITDGYEGNYATAWVTVTVTPLPDPPVVVNPGDQINFVGDKVSLQIVASDPDGDILAYSSTGLPPGLNINSGTGVISGKITGDSLGNWKVRVTVSDGDAETEDASVNFNWKIDLLLVFLPITIGD